MNKKYLTHFVKRQEEMLEKSRPSAIKDKKRDKWLTYKHMSLVRNRVCIGIVNARAEATVYATVCFHKDRSVTYSKAKAANPNVNIKSLIQKLDLCSIKLESILARLMIRVVKKQ